MLIAAHSSAIWTKAYNGLHCGLRRLSTGLIDQVTSLNTPDAIWSRHHLPGGGPTEGASRKYSEAKTKDNDIKEQVVESLQGLIYASFGKSLQADEKPKENVLG